MASKFGKATKTRENAIIQRAINVLVRGNHGPSNQIGGDALYNAILIASGRSGPPIIGMKRIADKVLDGYFIATRPKRKIRRNGSKKYRLMSARKVAKRLRLPGLKRFVSAARKSRRNCGCKRKK